MLVTDLPCICIFGFNRPEKLEITLQSLLRCNGAELFDYEIFIDGPRDEFDDVKIKTSIRIVNSVMAGLNYKIFEETKNRGLKNSIIDGVGAILDRYHSVIVIEDDLFFHPMFLDYMVASLRKYDTDNKVRQISGFTSGVSPEHIKDSDNFFIGRSHSWGWATWSSKWHEIKWDNRIYIDALKDIEFQKALRKSGTDLLPMLKASIEGRISSWAVLFCADLVLRKGLVSYPKHSLVLNHGFGGDATNCKREQKLNVHFKETESRGLVLKDIVEIDSKIAREFYAQYSFFNRLKRLIISRLIP